MRANYPTTFVIGGGNDEGQEGTWVWPSDGQVFFRLIRSNDGHLTKEKVDGQFVNWTPTSPTWNEGNNCMTMIQGGANAGMWKDQKCNSPGVLCEARVVKGTALYLDDLP